MAALASISEHEEECLGCWVCEGAVAQCEKYGVERKWGMYIESVEGRSRGGSGGSLTRLRDVPMAAPKLPGSRPPRLTRGGEAGSKGCESKGLTSDNDSTA